MAERTELPTGCYCSIRQPLICSTRPLHNLPQSQTSLEVIDGSEIMSWRSYMWSAFVGLWLRILWSFAPVVTKSQEFIWDITNIHSLSVYHFHVDLLSLVLLHFALFYSKRNKNLYHLMDKGASSQASQTMNFPGAGVIALEPPSETLKPFMRKKFKTLFRYELWTWKTEMTIWLSFFISYISNVVTCQMPVGQ